MKKLERLVIDFFFDKMSANQYATITRDLFDRTSREINEGSITKGDNACIDYEIEIVLEVIDKGKFPHDYKALTELHQALIEIEQ